MLDDRGPGVLATPRGRDHDPGRPSLATGSWCRGFKLKLLILVKQAGWDGRGWLGVAGVESSSPQRVAHPKSDPIRAPHSCSCFG